MSSMIQKNKSFLGKILYKHSNIKVALYLKVKRIHILIKIRFDLNSIHNFELLMIKLMIFLMINDLIPAKNY